MLVRNFDFKRSFWTEESLKRCACINFSALQKFALSKL